MDAFSLSIIYGTYGIEMRRSLFLSFIVGIFHFLMPIIGVKFGSLFSSFIYNVDFVVGIIFLQSLVILFSK